MNDDGGPRAALDDEQFRRLAEYGDVEHVEAGRDLYATGDDSYDFFLLRTASVDIVRDATMIEPERRIYRTGPGDFLGELSLLTGQHVYLTARVVSAGTVVGSGRRCCAVPWPSRSTSPTSSSRRSGNDVRSSGRPPATPCNSSADRTPPRRGFSART
ncbi:cyclic nucleotide-binding domain-containing protein [Micromonospora sp. M12]